MKAAFRHVISALLEFQTRRLLRKPPFKIVAVSGAVGKTTRVFQICREETATLTAAQLPGELALLQQRVKAAEAAAAEYLKRAELAEFREQAHQDHWALEVDRLRQELAVLRGPLRVLPV